MSDRLGQQLGNYRLISLLGQGGFARVYLGEHIYLKSQAAIKILYAQLAQDELNTFLTEARTLVQLIHPHIVRVLDFGVAGETPFLVMDYAPNGSLRERHPRGSRLPLPTIVEYVNQVASGLQYAHNFKVVHRDIKPENMLVGRQHEILLSDFGTAIVAQSSQYQIEHSPEVAGTIVYMAPEQISSHARPASDQYALGIVVYEWLSGERPFQGSLSEVVARQAFAPPPSLRAQLPSLPPAVEQVVMRALEKEPTARFANVQQFAQALAQASTGAQSYLSDLSDEPTRQVGTSPAPPPIVAPPTQYAPPQQPASPQGRELPASSPWRGQASPQDPVSPPWRGQAPPLHFERADAPPQKVGEFASSTANSTQTEQVQPAERRRPLYPLVVVISLLLVIFVIIGLLFANKVPFNGGATAGTSTTTASSTASAATYPDIAGNYRGPIHNGLANIDSTMALSLQEDQGKGTISGQFTVNQPLAGSGPFAGNIGKNGTLQFIVHSNDTAAPILFKGTLQADKSLSGTYCSVNQNNQCDTNAGGFGTWSATPTS